jgi:hypothetical protein
MPAFLPFLGVNAADISDLTLLLLLLLLLLQVAASIQQVCQSKRNQQCLVENFLQSTMLRQQQRLQHTTAQQHQADHMADSSHGTDPTRDQAGSSSSTINSNHFEFISQLKNTKSGYTQTFAVSRQDSADDSLAASSSGDVQQQQQQQQMLFPEVLRIPLRQEEKQESLEGEVDVYSLSRWVMPELQEAGGPRVPASISDSFQQCL